MNFKQEKINTEAWGEGFNGTMGNMKDGWRKSKTVTGIDKDLKFDEKPLHPLIATMGKRFETKKLNAPMPKEKAEVEVDIKLLRTKCKELNIKKIVEIRKLMKLKFPSLKNIQQ